MDFFCTVPRAHFLGRALIWPGYLLYYCSLTGTVYCGTIKEPGLPVANLVRTLPQSKAQPLETGSKKYPLRTPGPTRTVLHPSQMGPPTGSPQFLKTRGYEPFDLDFCPSCPRCMASHAGREVLPPKCCPLLSSGVFCLVILGRFKHAKTATAAKTSLKSEFALLETLQRLLHLVQFVKYWSIFLWLNSK